MVAYSPKGIMTYFSSVYSNVVNLLMELLLSARHDGYSNEQDEKILFPQIY